MRNITFISATNNRGKLDEIRHILRGIGCGCVSLKEAGLDVDIAETGATFAQNAYIKAKAIYDRTGKPVIADDSGLCVDALGGQPGVHTARYAGPEQDSEANIDLLLANMDKVPFNKRSARFVSAVCAIVDAEHVYAAQGWCEGFIGPERRGGGGFGYDPVFWLRGNRSMAELSAEKKSQMSHRARAIRKLAFKMRKIQQYRSHS